MEIVVKRESEMQGGTDGSVVDWFGVGLEAAHAGRRTWCCVSAEL